MKKILVTAVALALVGGAGYLAYRFFTKNKIKTKDDAIKYLKNNLADTSGSRLATISGWDGGFLINWATAMRDGNTMFMYNGKQYLTKTARAV